MENLYRLKEFKGKLPNPRHFPIQGASIYTIKDRPYAFSDGFMLDLSVRETDKEMLEGKVVRILDTSYIAGFIEDAKKSELLLSEPEFISDATYPAYVVFTPKW